MDAGEPVGIDVRVRNPTDAERRADVSLEMFGERVNATDVTVPAGDEQTVQFVHTFSAAGVYHPSAENASATLEVRGEGTTETSRTTEDGFPLSESLARGDPATTAGVLAVALCILLVLAVALARAVGDRSAVE